MLKSSMGASLALALCVSSFAHASVNFTAAQTVRTTSDFLFQVVAGDLDGDGDLDLVANEYESFTSTLRVLRNDGGLSFPLASSLAESAQVTGIALLQVDGDGDLDLVVLVSGIGATELVTYPGDGIGGFGAPQRQALANPAYSAAFRDIDADGDVDVAIPSFRDVAGPGGTVTVRTLVTWLDGGAALVAAQTVDLPTDYYFYGFAHWDDDAYPDAVLRTFAGDAAPQVLRGSAAGFVAPAESAPALPESLRAMAEFDADGVGVPELVTLADASETEVDDEDVNCALRIHARDGSGVLTAATAPATRPAPCGDAASFLAQDLDGDGAAELLYRLQEGYDFGALGLFELTGAAAPTQRQRFPVAGVRAAVDLDGDGRRDLLTATGHEVVVAPGSATPNQLPVAPTLTFYAGGSGRIVGSFATTDPDDNPLFYDIVALPAWPWATFGFSPNDGSFDFEWSTAGAPTARQFTVRVSDRSGTPVDYVVVLEPGSNPSGGGGGGGGGGSGSGSGGGASDPFALALLLAFLAIAVAKRAPRGAAKPGFRHR